MDYAYYASEIGREIVSSFGFYRSQATSPYKQILEEATAGNISSWYQTGETMVACAAEIRVDGFMKIFQEAALRVGLDYHRIVKQVEGQEPTSIPGKDGGFIGTRLEIPTEFVSRFNPKSDGFLNDVVAHKYELAEAWIMEPEKLLRVMFRTAARLQPVLG